MSPRMSASGTLGSRKLKLTRRPYASRIYLSGSLGVHAVENYGPAIERRIPLEYDPVENRGVLLRRRGGRGSLPQEGGRPT